MAAVDTLLRRMGELHSSDMHLASGFRPYFRIHGSMVEQKEWPVLTASNIMALVKEIAPPHNVKQFEEEHDTDFAHEIPGENRYRVNVFQDRFGPGVVMRVIPTDIPSVEKLGLPAAVSAFSLLSKGLVLVTGPTGSGKSTTLAAIIDQINSTRDEHIITIEDPIEFVHPPKRCLVNQREIHRDTESFSKALRAALREDPDIVLVGEMRDLETIEIALETAETGHLVFGTVHTNSAAATIDRIIDKFPSDRQNQIRTLLGDTLQGVVAQTLCKKIGGGRVAAFEILIVNTPVAAHIREGKTFLIPSVMQTSKALGMQTFCDDLTNLVLRGKITCEEAYIKAVNKEEMRVTMENAGLPLDFLKIEKHDNERSARIAAMVNDLQAALKSNPDDPGTLNDLAWILAASPIESFRDGKTAFKLAERLSKIEGETIQSLDALGTAYAAVGNYKMGAERLERALAMAKAEKAEELIGPLTMRMNFFKKGRVYSDETIGSDR